MVPELTRGIRAVTEHFGPGRFTIEQSGCGLGVTVIAGPEIAPGNQTSVGLGAT